MFQSVLRRLRDAQTAELEGEAAAESGFTLIELMVVLLIIAILLAIAIPTFLGVTGSANDRAAQSNLTNALTEASAVYQGNNQSYSGIQTTLSTSAPEFTWLSSGTTMNEGTNQIGIAVVDTAAAGDAQGVELANYSKTGTCWWALELSATPVAIPGTDASGVQFAKSLSLGAAGGEAGATTGGTFYAQKKNATQAQCVASYPQTDTAGFTWGPSYASAGTN
jgi:prepilin-type N-terminal cleavage/methylation domain-containing protein